MGCLDQSWIPCLILDVPGPRARSTPSSSGYWGLHRGGLPYSFLECWAQSWVSSLILRESGTRSSPTISLDFPPPSRSPKPVEDLGRLQLIPSITLSCWCGWTDRWNPGRTVDPHGGGVLSWKFCLELISMRLCVPNLPAERCLDL